jgi:hypothetical protein
MKYFPVLTTFLLIQAAVLYEKPPARAGEKNVK